MAFLPTQSTTTSNTHEQEQQFSKKKTIYSLTFWHIGLF